MKKSELLELLSAVPGNPEVCIVDTQKNDKASPNRISSLEIGVYSKFELNTRPIIPGDETSKKWLSISYHPNQL